VKFVVTVFFMLSLLACASFSVDSVIPLRIEGMQIENQTQVNVSAVRLLVPITGKYVSCGNIPPGSMCSTTFPEIEYTGNPVEITWSQGGQIFSTGQFAVKLPDEWDEDKPVIVLVVIAGPGSAGAMIVQLIENTP